MIAHWAALGELHPATLVVACPREKHANTYERLFGFETLAAPRAVLLGELSDESDGAFAGGASGSERRSVS